MAWVWHSPKEVGSWGADIDYVLSAPLSDVDSFSSVPLDLSRGRAIYKSRSEIEKFTRLHCPPIGIYPVVDKVWQDIILRYVKPNRVQFYPVRLVARGKVCDDYSWVIPFDRVRCIDTQRSKISRKIEKPNITLIFGVEEYVHVDGCLGKKHLARDEQQTDHMVLSDELRDALAATGESSMFYRPEDVPTLFGKNGLFPGN